MGKFVVRFYWREELCTTIEHQKRYETETPYIVILADIKTATKLGGLICEQSCGFGGF